MRDINTESQKLAAIVEVKRQTIVRWLCPEAKHEREMKSYTDCSHNDAAYYTVQTISSD